MVTGIETAGLVLGAFPLAIEGIKAYSDGMKTVKDMKNYEQILRQFARELKVERCKYDNTFLGLLTELVGPAKASRMKTDLQGDGWNDEDFRSQLKAQMGPAEETLDNWLYVAKQLNETLSTVCEKFKLSPEQEKKPAWILKWRRQKFDPRLAWDVGMLGEYRKAEQIGLIRQRNVDLITLANGGRKSTSSGSLNSPTVSPPLIKYHQRVQRHAGLLYSTLREKLGSPICQCGVPHSAHLELKMRSMPPTKAPSKSQADIDLHGPNQYFAFSLLFSVQNSGHDQLTAMWREFQLEPIDNRSCRETQPSPRHTVEIALPPSSSSPSLPVAAPTSERGRSVAPSQSPSLSPMSAIKFHLTPPILRGKSSRTPSPHTCESRPTTQTPTNLPPAKTIEKEKKTRFADGDACGEDDDNITPHAFSDLPTIPCFCTTLATYTAIHIPNPPPKCVGLLISTDKHEHRVWALLQQFPKPARFVSLADLITTYTTTLDKPSRASRLVLGLKLISSVLQLNSTQWLTEIWEAKDILFPEASLQVTDKYRLCNILSRPFVHRNFSSSGSTAVSDEYSDSQQQERQAKSVMGCNPSLYSLGIVFLELWHWQTFSSLYKSSAGRLSELEFSYHLSEALFEEAGHEYAMAVRRCIRGFEMRETNFEDGSFRRKVYQDVLGLLEENLRTFSKCDNIQKIIGEE